METLVCEHGEALAQAPREAHCPFPSLTCVFCQRGTPSAFPRAPSQLGEGQSLPKEEHDIKLNNFEAG